MDMFINISKIYEHDKNEENKKTCINMINMTINYLYKDGEWFFTVNMGECTECGNINISGISYNDDINISCFCEQCLYPKFELGYFIS
ncbi:hypothetical protein AHEV_050 [Adoxophyes honmai entomopoxvirus 'L']|uniref:Uncharacterized protein n=1 Tax=Adoxophyes honmai entomopoxvirus 'L' TaxID=1293540 RepID=A0A916KNY4_9POXV|nr:hypothetical protein AHEV_050 [Adoxophyes honmai entomopoxvirus 'L']CCU55371.1 hypothetical protein AHEV_050 [Adoxophyes honmai entomopoxvirus 'L']